MSTPAPYGPDRGLGALLAAQRPNALTKTVTECLTQGCMPGIIGEPGLEDLITACQTYPRLARAVGAIVATVLRTFAVRSGDGIRTLPEYDIGVYQRACRLAAAVLESMAIMESR